jgi:hypothetical protein
MLLVLFLSVLLVFSVIGCSEMNKTIGPSSSSVPSLKQIGDEHSVQSGHLYCFASDGKLFFEGDVENFSIEKRNTMGASYTYSPFVYWNDSGGNYYQWNGIYFFTTNPKG